MMSQSSRVQLLALTILCAAFATSAWTAPLEPVHSLAAKEKAPLLDTLKELVSIESGSSDREGLDRIAAVIATRLQTLGGQVETIEPNPADTYRMVDTPKEIGKMVLARFTGTGTKKILLIAHMDTVYQRGMLEKQPFRIDGNRAYGLGIADDKNGIAVILHTLAILKAMNFRDYSLITVLINADEEVSSAGSRALLTKLGAEHDVVFSCEGTLVSSDRLSLTTAGIGAVLLNITGRASHAGQAPELGRNALLELAHQMLQTRDLSDPSTGLKMNWTLGTGGTLRNIIPPVASAVADVRVLRVADYDAIERKVRAHQEPAHPRHQGGDDIRTPAPAPGNDRRLAGARQARPKHLCRDRPEPRDRRSGRRGRHRCGVRGTADEGAGARTLRAARLRRALERG
jgi:glutamate carboxypeptidase